MKAELQETVILEEAIHAFHEATGLRIELDKDALANLVADNIKQKFLVEIKARLTNPILGLLIHQFEQLPQKGLLVTDYVNPQMAERLRELKMQFIDTAGNAYINVPPIYVYIKGNKKPDILLNKKNTRAFQPTGLKVVFAFLCNPELVNAPYRDIAKVAKVALGTVGWVVADLKEGGYLVDKGKNDRRLVNCAELLQRWVIAYPDQLRHKLILGRYAAPNEHGWWNNVPIFKYKACWGGEVAAAQLTQYLRPERITIYYNDKDKVPGFLLTNKLRKDPNGNVELLKAFWDIKCDWNNEGITHPILVYADLLATGDTRNIEAANIIYEKELIKFIRKD